MDVAGSSPAYYTKTKIMGSHVPMAGVSPLQGESGGFDSLRVHKQSLTKVGAARLSTYRTTIKAKDCNLGLISRLKT